MQSPAHFSISFQISFFISLTIPMPHVVFLRHVLLVSILFSQPEHHRAGGLCVLAAYRNGMRSGDTSFQKGLHLYMIDLEC